MLRDLRYGLRVSRRWLASSVLCVLTLALGIGASVTVFSVVNAILLKPLPYRDPERVVMPLRQAPASLNIGYKEIPWNWRSFRLFLRESKSFQDLGAFKGGSFNLTGAGDPALVEGMRVSAGFFPALGMTPALGRTFTPEEDRPGYEREVILSHRLWQERFGSDRAILGRPVELDGEVYSVIGVMPPGFNFPRAEEMPGGFNFPREAQIWVPLALPEAPPQNAPSDLALIGRLKPGVTIEQAQREMDIFAGEQEAESPRLKGWFNTQVRPLAQQAAGDTRQPLLLILGAVGIVLLIACINVGNLLLARAIARQGEFTLRAALGAGRGRLVRQLLSETLVLVLAGGFLGMLLAQLGIRFVKVFGPPNIPRLHEVGIDLRVTAFALAVTLVTGVLVGLMPAAGAGRVNLVDSLKEGGQRSVGRAGGGKVRKFLVVSQVALAFVLVVAAALLSRTLFSLLRTDGGFRTEHVLVFETSLPSTKYADEARVVALYKSALQAFREVPGVQSCGIAYAIPLEGVTEGSQIRIPDRPETGEQDKRPFANYNVVSPGYFNAIGTPLLRGRDFLDSDTAESVPVVVINDAMAKKFWPGEDPVGKQVGLGSTRFPLMTIVGIVADVKHLSLRESPGPEMYVPYTQKPYPSMLLMHVVLRGAGDAESLTQGIRQALGRVDPGLPMAKVTTLEAIVDNSLAQPRFSMLLLAAFGGVALLLACVGMYGIISYSVAQRTREIGIRLAIGAQPRQVLWMVLGQGARLAGLGIVIGLLAALAATRIMTSFLYGVRATDPVTFAGMTLLFVVVALLACYLPARRATRVDPLTALRYE